MYNMRDSKRGESMHELVELMDIYAMDRAICRVVSKIAHPKLNPISAKTFETLNLKHRNQLFLVG